MSHDLDYLIGQSQETKKSLLVLDGCGLTEVPEILATFDWVTVLQLNNNSLTHLHNLPPNLKILSCKSNKLVTLDESTIPESVNDLDVSHNELIKLSGEDLPEDINQLNCSSNLIKEVCELPDNLAVFTCYRNMIESIDGFPDMLEKMDISENRLTELPYLDKCSFLHYLDCSSNRLVQLDNIPENIVELVCCCNQLSDIGTLPSAIEKIDCSDNHLEYLPELPEGLEYIDCSNNSIECLPTLPESLQNMDCSKNKLESLPDSVKRLNTIDFSHNPKLNLPDSDSEDDGEIFKFDWNNTATTVNWSDLVDSSDEGDNNSSSDEEMALLWESELAGNIKTEDIDQDSENAYQKFDMDRFWGNRSPVIQTHEPTRYLATPPGLSRPTFSAGNSSYNGYTSYNRKPDYERKDKSNPNLIIHIGKKLVI